MVLNFWIQFKRTNTMNSVFPGLIVGQIYFGLLLTRALSCPHLDAAKMPCRDRQNSFQNKSILWSNAQGKKKNEINLFGSFFCSHNLIERWSLIVIEGIDVLFLLVSFNLMNVKWGQLLLLQPQAMSFPPKRSSEGAESCFSGACSIIV